MEKGNKMRDFKSIAKELDEIIDDIVNSEEAETKDQIKDSIRILQKCDRIQKMVNNIIINKTFDK